MKTIKADNKIFGCHIVPLSSSVHVEIYWQFPDGKHEFHATSKSFGRFFRGSPIESDYTKAREWAENQLRCIENANKD